MAGVRRKPVISSQGRTTVDRKSPDAHFE